MKKAIIIFWILFFLFIIVSYFFYPDIFQHLFFYPGPGSPFVNTPNG